MSPGARRRLHALAWLATLLISPGAGARGTVDERWPITLDSGTRITVVLRRPADAEEPLPVVLLFGGFEGADRMLEYIETDSALMRVSFIYPWDVPARRDLWSLPAHMRAFDAAVTDTFDGISKLVTALRRRQDVDPDRIAIAGASAGAPFATIAAARDGIPAAIIVQGFGDIATVIGRQFDLYARSRHGPWITPLSYLLAHFIVWRLDLPHPEDHARQLQPRQQVLMINARDDTRIPRSATETLWRAIQAGEARATRIDLPGEHLYGYGDPAIRPILGRALDWMRHSGLLDAPPAADTRRDP